MSKKLFYVILLAMLFFGLSACTGNPTPQVMVVTATTKPTEQIMPTRTAVEQIPATVKPTVEPTAEPTKKVEQAKTVEYSPPENYIPLPEGRGVTYTINREGPYVVDYPDQSTLLIAVGKARINNEIRLTTDGTVGNIFADVCQKESGCQVTLAKYKAGHAQVTIVFGGEEKVSETVAGAVNTMLEGASNCGNKCLTIFIGYVNGDKKPFTAPIEPADVDLKDPQGPFAEVKMILPGVPSGQEIVLNQENTPIGQEYFLADSPAKVSVPETGGTIVYCGAKCTINGDKYDAGMAIIFVGTTDNSTPKDLNRTIEIESNDPTMIRVIMISDANFQGQVEAFKVKYPDWEWPKN